MRDFILFTAKVFFIMLIALGALFLLFSVDFIYILAYLGVFVAFFLVRLIMVIIKTNKHYEVLEQKAREQQRVEYVIIK